MVEKNKMNWRSYPKKYIWGPTMLDEELKKIAEKARDEFGVPINPSDVAYKLAFDLRTGNIKLVIPKPIIFNQQMFINIGDKQIKKKRIKTNGII